MEDSAFAGEGDRPVSQWCAVYDTRTGAVVHVHEHIGLAGERPLSEEALAEDALAEVTPEQRGRPFAVAHPREHVALQAATRYHVEVGVLLALPRARPGPPPGRRPTT